MTKTQLSTSVREEVLALLEQHETLTPKQLLSIAKRRKKSAIYRWLEEQGAFDERKALEFTGLSFCRALLMRVKIVVPDGAGKVRRIRATVSLAEDRPNGLGYRFSPRVMADDEMREQMKATFAKELRALEKRYAIFADLEPFAEVFKAIQQVQVSGLDAASEA